LLSALQLLFMSHRDHGYHVYLVASITRVLYCGVTNNIRRRVEEHRQGTFEGFSANYNCKRLVWFEHFQYVDNALAREKQIKRWRREKKVMLIVQANPTWIDLSEEWREATAGTSTPLPRISC